MDSLSKVLFISGTEGDTQRYRCHHHQEQLSLAGIASELRRADEPLAYADVLDCDLLILHRAPYTNLVANCIEIAHARGLPVIFETDDLIFDPSIIDLLPIFQTLAPEPATRLRQALLLQCDTFSQCDAVLTTTYALANEASRCGKAAYVQRNACSAEMVSKSLSAYIARRNAPAKETITIGYFSGSGSHNRDFALMSSGLMAILDLFPQVTIHLGGQLELDDRWHDYAQRIQRSPYIPWRDLPAQIAKIDINLAPLDVQDRFCQAKSEIKYSEAALVGVPTIASPTDAFRHAIQNGVNGLLATEEDEWISALTLLIEQPDTRKRMGEAAHQHILTEYLPQPRSQELLATLNQIRVHHAQQQAEPVTLNATLTTVIKRISNSFSQQATALQTKLSSVEAHLAEQSATAQFWQQHSLENDRRYQEALRELMGRLQRRVA